MEAQKSIEKCVQELCVNRKPHHAGLDPAELQQVIHDWDSDTEGDINDDFSEGSKPLYKDVMPQHEEVIKNPSTVKIQQYVKEKDIHDTEEHSLYDKTLGTKEKNAELNMSVKSQKHSESSLVSRAISVELKKVNENISTSKNEECEVNKNSKSKNTVTATSVHEIDTAKNVKTRQLKSHYSRADRGNVQQTEGLRVTHNVPSSDALVQQSRTLERSVDSSKTSSHKRRLYSPAESPEVIEKKDYDNISTTCNILLPHSSRETKKIILTNRKRNVNKTPIKEVTDDNGERRKIEPVLACHEQDQLGVKVSRFGRLSQRGKLDVSKPCHFSTKGFSGRWRNKHLEEVGKHKLEKKGKENVQRAAYSSVYSDINETDSDSVLSWLEPGKPKILEVGHTSGVTYEKRRTTNRSKEKKKWTILTKHRKKCKNNTSTNRMSEGSWIDGDGRTMTMNGIPEADGK